MSTPRFGLDAFPTLETQRLVLRDVELADVDDVFAWRSDPEVQPYNSAPHRTLDDTRAFITTERAMYRRGEEIPWGLMPRGGGPLVGSISLFEWMPTTGTPTSVTSWRGTAGVWVSRGRPWARCSISVSGDSGFGDWRSGPRWPTSAP